MTVLARDVFAFTEVDGLVEATAFGEGIEVANLCDASNGRDIVVGWDCDVACGFHLMGLWTVEETDANAPFGVVPGDEARGCLVELVFQLAASAIGSPGGVRSIDVLEGYPLSLIHI